MDWSHGNAGQRCCNFNMNDPSDSFTVPCAGKLKDLGNTVLGKFGMSLDNFKMDKDPNTGSYSINFKQ